MNLLSLFHIRPLRMKRLDALLPELRTILRELDRIERIDDPCDRLIELFRTIAPWHDQSAVWGVAEFFRGADANDVRIYSLLAGIQTHIKRAGRDLSGMNRTRSGEWVTADVVFLGGVWGLFTHTITFWRSRRDDSPIETMGLGEVTAYQIVCRQAADFARGRINGLRATIKELDAVVNA
ncbi:MAG: hypothetical protein HY340_02125 [Candidatus Kerfeldbacteria bacterium]|nr:hypothetical protein [Candidatus Kerfeldbacteria bacterium]